MSFVEPLNHVNFVETKPKIPYKWTFPYKENVYQEYVLVYCLFS